MMCPCKDCEKKGCGAYHDECEEYQAYRQSITERREYERKERMQRKLTIKPKKHQKGENQMTDRERAIVMAYTGDVMLTGKKMQIYYDYLRELFGRPIYTNEIPYMSREIRYMARDDFCALCKDENEKANLDKSKP